MTKKNVHEQKQAETDSIDTKSQEKTTSIDNEQCQMQIDDLTDTLKRLQAEFENYKKRVEKDNANLIKNSNAGLIKNMLPVLDSFELAIKNSNGNEELEKFRKGLELIYAQFFGILEENGLRPIDTKNQVFDPFKHEVLMVKESKEKDDLILQEFQKGYMLGDNVLRHSKVMISKYIDVKNNDG